MNTYLVVFDCLVMAEPYFEHIKAHSLSECWDKAYKMSLEIRELSTGNFEIYKLMTEEDYEADPGFHFVEENFCDEEDC